jgi:hypothetical protein
LTSSNESLTLGSGQITTTQRPRSDLHAYFNMSLHPRNHCVDRSRQSRVFNHSKWLNRHPTKQHLLRIQSLLLLLLNHLHLEPGTYPNGLLQTMSNDCSMPIASIKSKRSLVVAFTSSPAQRSMSNKCQKPTGISTQRCSNIHSRSLR